MNECVIPLTVSEPDAIPLSVDPRQPAPQPRYQDKSVTVTQNGEMTVTPDDGYDALSSVEVETEVPVPVIEPLTVGENGTYTAEEGKAFGTVNVTVPGIIKMTTTYAPVTDIRQSISFPLPSSDFPKLVIIRTRTQATQMSDYTLGEIISVIAVPVHEDELTLGNCSNCVASNCNLATGRMSVGGITQITADSSSANGNYFIDTVNKILNIKNGNNFVAIAGVTYDIECYY